MNQNFNLFLLIYHGRVLNASTDKLRPTSLAALSFLWVSDLISFSFEILFMEGTLFFLLFGFDFFLLFININNMIFKLGIFYYLKPQYKIITRSSMWPWNVWIRNMICILHHLFLGASDFHRLGKIHYILYRLGRLGKDESLSLVFNNTIRWNLWNRGLHNKSGNLILFVFLFLQQPRRYPNLLLHFFVINLIKNPKILCQSWCFRFPSLHMLLLSHICILHLFYNGGSLTLFNQLLFFITPRYPSRRWGFLCNRGFLVFVTKMDSWFTWRT